MEHILIHPDTFEALTTHIFTPLLSGDRARANHVINTFIPNCIADLIAPFDYNCLKPLENEISRLKYMPLVILDYCKTFLPTTSLTEHQWNMLKCIADHMNSKINWINDDNLESSYIEILNTLWPHELKDRDKVRIGGNKDGGYVFIEQKNTGIAYSFGISGHSPWDLEMAQRGYIVYQFDGTIKEAPDKHPNLRFTPKNIVASSAPKPNEKNIAQIFADLGHEDQTDLILQIDIEGAEWNFFEKIEENQISKFSQIIAEFHGLGNKDFLQRAHTIFKKICKTHLPIHFHNNNCCGIIGFRHFLFSPVIEVTFVRKDIGEFSKSKAIFPTPLDKPNLPQTPDIYIGRFNEIITTVEPESTPPPPRNS